MAFIISLLLIFLTLIPQTYAIYDPLSRPNNRYGIHIVDTSDVPDLAKLVNSQGGDWGYVTMVLSDNDRDAGRWQTIFDQLRREHLIPIIRLATHVENRNWVKPMKDRFYEIVTLLSSLNWPTENRYIILYNEPNHANEWGGTLDPEDYAATFVGFATELKKANADFFILPAGLDASSADDDTSMDEATYIQRMIASRPEMLSLMDGWASHSYPNPGFSGSPYARGRGTLSTFDWELNYLQSLGLTKTLPVFITETGWEHAEGKDYIRGLLSADQVGTNVQVAAANIWTDPRIAAITPFIYNYQDIPFDHFSWRRLGSNDFYPFSFIYQEIIKIKGQPKQRESYVLQNDLLPPKLIAGSSYTLSAQIKNTGQGILDPMYYALNQNGSFPVLEPDQTGTLTIHLTMPKKTGQMPLSVQFRHNGQDIVLASRAVTLVPPPTVEVHANLGWRKTGEASHVSVLVYDKDTLLQKFTGLSMKKGTITTGGLLNIIPGHIYRVVTLVPGYLPRQVIGALGDNNTAIYPNRFLPLDFNGDGKFSIADVMSLLHMSPITALSRFFGP